ncbi:hypothetical protein BT69DRAFT_1283551 [Atractiella rhizophila]|nr:hypothetical protein BT69DRAFT_1283551 [Atractiella rhizophila]
MESRESGSPLVPVGYQQPHHQQENHRQQGDRERSDQSFFPAPLPYCTLPVSSLAALQSQYPSSMSEAAWAEKGEEIMRRFAGLGEKKDRRERYDTRLGRGRRNCERGLWEWGKEVSGVNGVKQVE